MSHFAQRCGVHDAAREQAVVQAIAQMEASGLDRVRIASLSTGLSKLVKKAYQ